MDNQSGQNNFELLPNYKQDSLCRETLALVRRIQLLHPELWAAIQAEAARKEVMPKEVRNDIQREIPRGTPGQGRRSNPYL